jgi:hypothetical protein
VATPVAESRLVAASTVAASVGFVSPGVLIPLFSPAQAPGIREGIRGRAKWNLTELDEGWGTIEPVEGSGAVREYFTVHKLCDASSEITEETWEPLRRAGAPWDKSVVTARTRPGGERTGDWAQQLLAWADKVYTNHRRGAEFIAIQATINALPFKDVPEYLTKQAALLFESFPNGSLWLVETDALLPARLSILRILLNQKLVPDVFPDSPAEDGQLVGLEMLQEHSLTGSTFAALLDPILLVFPPTTLGFSFDWMPHSLFLSTGFAGLLIEDHPPTFASVYSPRVQSGFGFHWGESKVWDKVAAATGETLLQWWVTRLNRIYSHACDPTQFADSMGTFRPTRQAAWLLTFERMLADLLVIRSSPQASTLALHQAAFDLLDKAEALLDYGSKKSGKGFQRLLRRGEMIDRLDRKWNTCLPVQLRSRFKQYTAHLYERLYEEIREEAYTHRVTDRGVLVWSEDDHRLIERQMDDYIPKLVRTIRNSAHGLIEQLESPDRHRERNLIATHTGKLPAVLPDLAALIGFALVADADALCDGTWLTD